jgi:hypothetical protein
MSATPRGPHHQMRRMRIIFGVALGAVLLYYAFSAVDRTGLPETAVAGVVAGKHYVPHGTTYVTQVINGRSYPIPQVREEMYVLMLDVGGRHAGAAVDKAVYDSLGAGDRISVTCRRRRLTGRLEVVKVHLP